MRNLKPVPSTKSSKPVSMYRLPSIGFLVLTLAVYLFSVVGTDIYGTFLVNLHPNPDSSEYFAMMRSIWAGRGPVIEIAGQQLPSRYPHGFSALAAPLLWFLRNEDGIRAPFIANMVWGLATLALIYVMLARSGEWIRAGIAVLLVASLPMFMAYSRSSMSEPAGGFFVVAAFLATRAGFRGSVMSFLAAAALVGLSLNIRISLFYFAPLLGAPVLCDALGSWMRRVSTALAGAVIALCCVSPTLLMNTTNFGSPLSTGYSYWAPGADSLTSAFGLAHVRPNIQLWLDELRLGTAKLTTAHIFGTGAHVVPAFGLLVALYGWPKKVTRFHVAALVAIASATVMSIAYFFLDLRLYYPLVLLAAIAASGGVARAIIRWQGGCQIAMGVLACLVTASAVIGYPSVSGFPQQGGRFQLIDGIQWSRPARVSYEYEAVRLARRSIDGPAVVLSNINPVYLSSLLGPKVLCAPVDGRHEYNLGTRWTYDSSSAEDLASQALARGQRVYCLAQPASNAARVLARAPLLKGTRWREVAGEASPYAIMWELAQIVGDSGDK